MTRWDNERRIRKEKYAKEQSRTLVNRDRQGEEMGRN
jgi:hypothetical protein